jgi:hypothetical protein
MTPRPYRSSTRAVAEMRTNSPEKGSRREKIWYQRKAHFGLYVRQEGLALCSTHFACGLKRDTAKFAIAC